MDLPAWIEACSTAAAAMFAAGALWYAKRAFGAQNEQLTRAQQFEQKQAEVMAWQAAELRESLVQRRRQQANLVYTTIEVSVTDRRDGYCDVGVDFTLTNQSTLPIYDVLVQAFFGGNAWTGSIDRSGEAERVMAPGAVLSTYGTVLADTPTTKADVVISARFRDHAGRSWRVAPDGTLDDLTDRIVGMMGGLSVGSAEDLPDERDARSWAAGFRSRLLE
ncbi:MAG TPA: hypothetical protein VFR11_22525 [Micromonosporaceae bacterium]|jgi:hypothetical protein|nr:hypothetical protein [Micromonosporaceae bacterium]